MKGRERRFPNGRRRKRPRVVKELLRIGVGPSMLYLIAGTERAVKMKREDMQRLEADVGKHIEEMYETDLVREMERLGIETIPLNNDEKEIVRLASKYMLAGYFLLTKNDTS
ncbi:MAG: hypothetical protein ACFFEE_03655 [Candidatus Thorarchaeota archaeon]